MERYYAFWRRFGAGMLDGLVLLLFSLFATKFMDPTDTYSLFSWTAAEVTFFILYNVVLTGLGGQTVGKILMGIKVLDINEREVIGIRRALLRDALPVFLEIVGLFLLAMRFFIQPMPALNSIAESFINNAWGWWFVVELLTMFLNPKGEHFTI